MLQMIIEWQKKDKRVITDFLTVCLCKCTIVLLNICALLRARFEGSVFQIEFVLWFLPWFYHIRQLRKIFFIHFQIEKLQQNMGEWETDLSLVSFTNLTFFQYAEDRIQQDKGYCTWKHESWFLKFSMIIFVWLIQNMKIIERDKND